MIKFGEHALGGEVTAQGWWKLWKGRRGKKKISIIDCGTGERAADCILFLKEAGVEKIFFFGFAGSVSDSLPPGSFCSPSSWAGGAGFEEFALGLRDGKLPRKTPRPFTEHTDGLKGVKEKTRVIYTLPSLFMERNSFKKLAEEGFDMVDMETAHAAFAAEDLNIRFLYYITDFKMEFTKIDFKKLSEVCLKSALS